MSHGRRKQLVEPRSAQPRDWVPPLGAIVAVGQRGAEATDSVVAAHDVGEGVGVLVQEGVEEAHPRLAGGEPGLVQQRHL